jgi:group I intron endonuclease
MAYIYKITNKLNNKSYIGKTEYTIEHRWKEHIRASRYKRNQSRALYRAMNKYGVENFECVLIKETSTPNEDESFFIQKYDTYHNGYNETLGGDGASYLNLPEEEICKFYLENQCLTHTAQYFGYDKMTIKKVLYKNKIPLFDLSSIMIKMNSQAVAQINPQTDEIIKIFSSIAEAEKATGNSKHISSVCRGKRKTAKGYKWKYVSDIEIKS